MLIRWNLCARIELGGPLESEDAFVKGKSTRKL